MKKVVIFLSDNCNKIEKDINEWIEMNESCLEVEDIKLTSSECEKTWTGMAMVIYKTKD